MIDNTMNYENTSIQIMNKINELFKKINLKNKIVFHYDFNEFKLKILRHLRKAKGIVSSYVEYDINIHASSLYFNFFLI